MYHEESGKSSGSFEPVRTSVTAIVKSADESTFLLVLSNFALCGILPYNVFREPNEHLSNAKTRATGGACHS